MDWVLSYPKESTSILEIGRRDRKMDREFIGLYSQRIDTRVAGGMIRRMAMESSSSRSSNFRVFGRMTSNMARDVLGLIKSSI